MDRERELPSEFFFVESVIQKMNERIKMDIIKGQQCKACLSWKQPQFMDITLFGEAPRWAIIWDCVDDKCEGETE